MSVIWATADDMLAASISLLTRLCENPIDMSIEIRRVVKGFRSRGGSPADDAVAECLMIGSARATLFARGVSSMRWNSAISALKGRSRQRPAGRPYHPSPMLKLYIYGYLNRVQIEPAAGA